MAAQIIGQGFHEVHVDATIEVCETRDPKGLYAAARAGKIAEFTGISAPYEAPESPALRLETTGAVDGTVQGFRRFIQGVVAG